MLRDHEFAVSRFKAGAELGAPAAFGDAEMGFIFELRPHFGIGPVIRKRPDEANREAMLASRTDQAEQARHHLLSETEIPAPASSRTVGVAVIVLHVHDQQDAAAAIQS